MLVLTARLPAEVGAAVLRSLNAAEDEASRDERDAAPDVSAETPAVDSLADDEPVAARRADALGRLAESFLEHPARPADGASAERHQIVVHVDEAALREDGDDARCEIEHGPAIAPDTARRLACDASVVRMVDNHHARAPLDVGRRTRSVPSALRRYLRGRDGGCRFPGCTRHRHVDAHHITHWADGGPTNADNLVLLCRRHHRLVHEGGYGVARHAGGELRFTDPRGRRLPACPAAPPVTSSLSARVSAAGIDVSAETLVPDWHGDRMDVGMAVDGLMNLDRRHTTPSRRNPAIVSSS